ncbi:MAG TPA: sugar kinase [Puia sp.]|jgi:2-dehydro-3-deoxygluconokinase
MGKTLCFGELLLRLSPAPQGEWLKTRTMPVFLGGAELNVASALGNWNQPVSYCTALPDNFLSADISGAIRERNISTDGIFYSGSRLGTYFLSQGDDMKHAGVIYDRDHSSFGELKRGMLDWDLILKDISWFHFSAISPALNASVAEVCREGLEAASKKNITISVDLNYRAKLWKERNPQDAMRVLCAYCDVIMGNIWSAQQLLGIPLQENQLDQARQESYLEQAEQASLEIMKRFPRCKTVANTFRFDWKEKGIEYYATLYSEIRHFFRSSVFRAETIVDKVGTGDCFMAGLIFGLLRHWPEEQIIQFAAAAAFGKFMETGDATAQPVEIIQKRAAQYV